MMEMSLYDQLDQEGLGLFMGPDLWPEAPAGDIRRSKVLQAYSASDPDSPTDELLQDSIWSQPTSPIHGVSEVNIVKKDLLPGISEDHLTSIHHSNFGQAVFLTEDLDINGLLDVVEPSLIVSSESTTTPYNDATYNMSLHEVNHFVSTGDVLEAKSQASQECYQHDLENNQLSYEQSDLEVSGQRYKHDVPNSLVSVELMLGQQAHLDGSAARENSYSSGGLQSLLDVLLHDPQRVCQLLKQLESRTPMDNQETLRLSDSPVLSPVSPEEVDSVLSSDHESSLTSQDSQSSSLSMEVPQITIAPIYRATSFTVLTSAYEQRESIKAVSPMVEKVQKKKEQNKSAALKYREKKKQEKGVVVSEVEQLEKKNSELKSKVDDLNKEITYLRNLIEEIRSKS